VNILWHLPPSESDDDAVLAAENANWSGRSVMMKIQPGSCYAGNDAQPKLVWTTVGGGSNGCLRSYVQMSDPRGSLDPQPGPLQMLLKIGGQNNPS
jgi:hypothetical protein